jgi:predicted dehydrogenase
MIKAEAALPLMKNRFCYNCYPNFAHFAPAMMALEHGFNV